MGSWAHGICSCCHDLGTCCVASCLPCVTFGQTAEMTGQGGCCCYGCLAFIPCLSIFLLCQQRGIIREKEDIPVSCSELFYQTFHLLAMYSIPSTHVDTTYTNNFMLHIH